MSFFAFLRYTLSTIKQFYLVNYQYPNRYKGGYFKTLVPAHFFKKKGLQIGESVIIKNPKLEIGDYTFVGNYTLINACDKIGKYFLISSNVGLSANLL